MSSEGAYLYRPSQDMASNMAADKLAYCAGCTQMHEDLSADTYRALCGDCGQHQVFGHLNFNKIV